MSLVLSEDAIAALKRVSDNDDDFKTIIGLAGAYGLRANSDEEADTFELPTIFTVVALTHLLARCVAQQQVIDDLRNQIVKLRVEFMATEHGGGQ